MKQLLLFVMVLVFGATNALAAPYSVCRHANAEAHALALASSGTSVAEEAHTEDATSAAAEKLASLADRVAATVALGVLPNSIHELRTAATAALGWLSVEPERLVGRAPALPLQPPSA